MKKTKNPYSGIFFLLTFSISWLFWGLLVFTGLPLDNVLGLILFILAGSGPPLSAILLIYHQGDKTIIRDYWQRLLSFRRLGWKGAIISLFCVPILTLVAGFAANIFYRNGGISLEPQFRSNLISLIPFGIFTLLYGPLPEEMGWRGYALDQLQKKLNVVAASLILGLLWALWHLPMFFIPGTYQNALLENLQALILFPVKIILHTLIMTWIFLYTQRSTLSAVLYHFSINFSGETFFLSSPGEMILLVILAFLATTVAIHLKKRSIIPT